MRRRPLTDPRWAQCERSIVLARLGVQPTLELHDVGERDAVRAVRVMRELACGEGPRLRGRQHRAGTERVVEAALRGKDVGQRVDGGGVEAGGVGEHLVDAVTVSGNGGREQVVQRGGERAPEAASRRGYGEVGVIVGQSARGGADADAALAQDCSAGRGSPGHGCPLLRAPRSSAEAPPLEGSAARTGRQVEWPPVEGDRPQGRPSPRPDPEGLPAPSGTGVDGPKQYSGASGSPCGLFVADGGQCVKRQVSLILTFVLKSRWSAGSVFANSNVTESGLL